VRERERESNSLCYYSQEVYLKKYFIARKFL
jgi:hypothetical protein